MRSAAEPDPADADKLFADESDLPRIGSYELLEEIGRGGMGIIYKARQIHTGRMVAVKILQPHIAQNPELLSRFRREAQTAARLDHPHVLPIYEVNDEADGILFFTMKLAAGGSLHERRGTLIGRLRKVATLMAKVARAAHHAHERGVLHRDLKPGNILFDSHDEPMVSDFGLAAWLHQDSDLTRSVLVFGTPGYLPPEYLQGRPDVLRPASDVFSLGVILFEYLSGRLPFGGEAGQTALSGPTGKPAQPLRKVSKGADRDLEVICSRCLELNPNDRYRSAEALAEDLERWLDGRPIIARPLPVAVRAWKLGRRHPAISLSIVLCCLLLATVFALRRATAYDRTITILPTEDLDTLSSQSPLAMKATQVFLEGVRHATDFVTRTAAIAPEPLPQHAELARLSEKLGSRYLLASTVRRQGDHLRLVLRVLNGGEGTPLLTEAIEGPELGDANTRQAIDNALRKIDAPSRLSRESSGTAPGETQDTRSRAADYIQAGNQHIERHTREAFDLAINAYEKALEVEPRNGEAMALLSSAMTLRGLVGERSVWLDKALVLATKAVETNPLLPEAHRTLSNVLSFSARLTEAREQALEAFELMPDDARFANIVAEAMMSGGAIDQALIWNRKATLRQSNPGRYTVHRGEYLTALGEYTEAEQAFREFIEFRPELADGYVALANLHFIEGDTALALEELRNLSTRFPTHPVVLQNRACLEFHAGNADIAETLFQQLSADEDGGLVAFLSVRSYSGLGYLALHRGAVGAGPMIEKALRLDEERLSGGREDATLRFEVAANLAMLGKRDEALDSLRKTLTGPHWTYHQVRLDPRLANLRDMPEFHQIQESLAANLSTQRNRYQATPSR